MCLCVWLTISTNSWYKMLAKQRIWTSKQIHSFFGWVFWWKVIQAQIRSDQSLSRVRLFATPWIAARQASLSITNSRSSLRLKSIESVMPSSHLILCRPLLLLPPIPPSISLLSPIKFNLIYPKLLSLYPNMLINQMSKTEVIFEWNTDICLTENEYVCLKQVYMLGFKMFEKLTF